MAGKYASMARTKATREEDHVAELIQRQLWPIVKRMALILEVATQEGGEIVAVAVEDASIHWARILLNPNDDTAPTVAADLIMVLFGEDPPAAWWRTELGQTIVSAGGFPHRWATRAEAAAVLRVSIQRARAITGRFLIAKPPSTLVTRESLMREWMHRQNRAHLEELRRLGAQEEVKRDRFLDVVMEWNQRRRDAKEAGVPLGHTELEEEKNAGSN